METSLGEQERDAYSAKVLKRDCGRTDYIVLPLAAAVLAQLVDAMPEREQADAEHADQLDRARAVLAVADTDDAAWEDAAVYGMVADFALMAWDVFQIG